MKPKGKKFRIRRTGAAPGSAASPAGATDGDAQDSEDGFGGGAFPGAAAAQDQQPPRALSIEEELAAIRQEGLTGRQLRMARRTVGRCTSTCSPSRISSPMPMLFDREGVSRKRMVLRLSAAMP